jgi:hypothetical protein
MNGPLSVDPVASQPVIYDPTASTEIDPAVAAKADAVALVRRISELYADGEIDAALDEIQQVVNGVVSLALLTFCPDAHANA